MTTNLYTFSGTAGQRLYFQGLLDSPGGNALAVLYGPGNNYITESYTEYSAQWTLPSTGTYIVAVEGVAPSTTGAVSYKFELFDNANPTSTLTLGTEVTGSLTNPGDESSFTFTGSMGERIYFDSRDQTPGIDAILTDPYGTAVFNNAFSVNEGPFTLSYDGTYTLTVYPTPATPALMTSSSTTSRRRQPSR